MPRELRLLPALALAACGLGAGDENEAADAARDGLACTLIFPSPGLTARLEAAPGTTLPAGIYDVTVTADGQTFVLRPEVLSPGGGTCLPEDCRQEVDVGGKRLFAEISLVGSLGYLYVGYHEDGGPSPIGLEVRLGSTAYASHTFTPTYVPVEVNGPGCGTTHQAMATVTLAAAVPP
ncbi:MAG: hypothetical protein F9K40_14830 [Kofleriaceae bacterium]|nr:MAG: hypothetical protein F9K40_14830 [Kofleriaceae bacterium]MBZ0234337.1 hypothetical protein [Kofleriaceae bacterium]